MKTIATRQGRVELTISPRDEGSVTVWLKVFHRFGCDHGVAHLVVGERRLNGAERLVCLVDGPDQWELVKVAVEDELANAILEGRAGFEVYAK